MSVTLEVQDHAARVVFSHPPVNALPVSVLRQLERRLREAAAREEVKIIVLASEGRTFCAGASFDELLRLHTPEEAVEFFMGFARVILAMRDAPQPVIVRVQGKTVGGGTGIVAAGDFAVAPADAAFKLSELSIGIGPYVIAPPIIRKTGIAFFQQMSMQPWKWFTAFEAAKRGLLTHVTENLKRADELIDTIIQYYKDYDAEAVRRLKAEIWQDTRDWDRLFREQAAKSAALLLRRETKAMLEKLRKR
ncbi:MAG: enoyl-CoA hydratase/isomerase family protein [Chlorobi bacterium]|nr:enoyl-CoA hydratase/isomerase family protein [Chlorobiota bacterium]